MRRSVEIGSLVIGGGAPVRVESMLKVALSDRERCLAQCESLRTVGCELARVALPKAELAEDLRWLLSRSHLPLMADIHFDPALALLAMEAGCRAIRINPGNMPLGRLEDVIATAKGLGAVIRIGANGGSLSNAQLEEARVQVVVLETVLGVAQAGYDQEKDLYYSLVAQLALQKAQTILDL
ncbi:MAG: flavodoxin-dependent (E)-4-hydroxy-3-methylbut-2-enyl-diphosphate synthase, partial [Synergistaceae bacterium]|nr:flavodoxin-dependent (E)-4-hydroxy-3-methylbut-2-enyl-diphosphate synthase [Synergistaceae bacterium]